MVQRKYGEREKIITVHLSLEIVMYRKFIICKKVKKEIKAKLTFLFRKSQVIAGVEIHYNAVTYKLLRNKK